MPIFEFVCKECDQEFEELIQGASQPRCPACDSEDLEKKLSGFAVAVGASKSAALPMGPCGSCGHPDGPGACKMG
ncbi:MAG: zinc ribbon domain-containing protein [Candidatus Latescibacteria bacterium]|nr:zinc ribbon domain-containing protein [Candidatus Latescibacterota bacterium]